MLKLFSILGVTFHAMRTQDMHGHMQTAQEVDLISKHLIHVLTTTLPYNAFKR